MPCDLSLHPSSLLISSLLLPPLPSSGALSRYDLTVAQGEHAIHSQITQKDHHWCWSCCYYQTCRKGTLKFQTNSCCRCTCGAGIRVPLEFETKPAMWRYKQINLPNHLSSVGCWQSKGAHCRAGYTEHWCCRGNAWSGGIFKGAWCCGDIITHTLPPICTHCLTLFSTCCIYK